MPSEPASDVKFEIGHVLFIDIVGYSKLLIHEQSDQLQKLKEIVRGTEQFRLAEAENKLLRLPTGDGGALVFRTTLEAPVLCALEIGKELRKHPELGARMGIHSGPVNEITDLNEQANIAGAGINIAQRVMDCGDAGHILLSKRVADDLSHYTQWRPHLHDLGQCEVKHGVKIEIVNLYTDKVGNPATPERIKKGEKFARLPRVAVIAAALLCIAVAIGAVILYQRSSTRSTIGNPLAEKRIAVLPFKPLVAENRDPVFELGMADTLIAKLSNTGQVIVSSLNSVRKYDALDQDAVAAGRKLQVNSVLEGNVQKVGDRIRVSARLLNVADGSSVWAATFDEKMTDVFAVQDTISQKVADALALRLSSEGKNRLTRRYTENVEAYQLYLTGRYQWSTLTPPDIRKSIGFFQRAIDLDPSYALAYYGLAEANRSLAVIADIPSKDCVPQAKSAAEKALKIDPLLAEAHSSLAFSLKWYDWDWTGAEREARRAIQLNPNSAVGHWAYAHLLSDLGRHDEAIAEGSRARKLEPTLMIVSALEGMFLIHARRNSEALDRLQKTLEINPNFWVTHLMLGRVYTQQRRYSEALDEFNKAVELSHGNSEAVASIGYAEALSGDAAKARAVVQQLKNSGHYVPPVNLALVFNGLGESDDALGALNDACDQRDVRLTLLKVDPRWDSFRSNPRFKAVLKRIGLQ